MGKKKRKRKVKTVASVAESFYESAEKNAEFIGKYLRKRRGKGR